MESHSGWERSRVPVILCDGSNWWSWGVCCLRDCYCLAWKVSVEKMKLNR